MGLSIKDRIIKRLDKYYQLEGFNAVFFFGISIYIMTKNNLNDIIFLTYGIWFMVYILVQGTIYWRLKMLSLKGKNINQKYFLSLFKRFKSSNNIFGIAIPFVFLIQWFISSNSIEWDSILLWGLLANAFALLEHYNYYQRQLMYDNPYDWQYLKVNKKLKIASLKKDLEEQKI